MRNIIRFTLALAFAMSFVSGIQATGFDEENPTPSVELGALIYVQRCSLCHGDSGKGDGILPRKIKSYPSTNLLVAKLALNRKEILEASIYGGSLGGMSNLMPPMGNDLTWTQLESVVDFVLLLRTEHTKAIGLLNIGKTANKVSKQLGQEVFNSRCVLCHGKYGEGDGRMARVIKSPPPFDLTASRQSDQYLRDIINEGGEYMKRSKQMPPWKDELDEAELASIIQFIKSIRD